MLQILWFICVRLALAFGTVAFVSVAIFTAAEIIPSDPAVAALGRESTPEQRAVFRERANLDAPAVERYLTWAGGVVGGDFGESAITGRPVGEELVHRTKFTAILALSSLAGGVIVALPIAVRAARRPGGTLDTAVSTIAVALVALPEFVVAMTVVLVFAVYLDILPVVSLGVTQGDWTGLILPTVALTLGAAAYVYRIARVSIQETLSASYIRSGILHGFSRARMMWRHVMPNAGIVIVNAVALNAIYLIGGVIVIETVFSYPGLGSFLVSAINDGDIVLIEGIGVIMAALFVFINFAADAAVLALNPKLRIRV